MAAMSIRVIVITAAVGHDRIPEAVGLGLDVGGDLERKRLAVQEQRASIQTQAGEAGHGEQDRQDIILLA